MRPTPNGQVVVFTDDERVIGLPAEERFEDERVFQGALHLEMQDRLEQLRRTTGAPGTDPDW